MTAWVQIEPLDVLMFRNAKPFTAREAFRAALVDMPPPPLAFAGALRALLMGRAGVDFEAYRRAARAPAGSRPPEMNAVFERYGGPDDAGALDFWGPFFVRHAPVTGQRELLLKAPLDVQAVFSRTTGSWRSVGLVPEAEAAQGVRVVSKPPGLRPLRSPQTTTGETTSAPGEGEPLDPGAGYLLAADFGRYLRGDLLSLSPVPDSQLWCPEPRTGVALGPTRTVREAHLYTAEFLRLKRGVGFCLRVSGDPAAELPAEGVLRLGGEGRCAAFRRMRDEGVWADMPGPAELVEPLSHASRFRLVALSPAVYRNGWLPDPVRDSPDGYRLPLPGGGEARLFAAAVGKPRPVVGWDLAARAPRPLLWAVPPGSVYWFDAGEPLGAERAGALLEWLHFTKATMEPWDGCPPLYRQAGFGLTAVGCLNLDT